MIALPIQDIIRNYFIALKELMWASFLFLLVLPINAITPTGFLLHEHPSFNSCVSLISGCTLKYLSSNKISQKALSIKAVSSIICLQMRLWAVLLSTHLKYFIYIQCIIVYILIFYLHTLYYISKSIFYFKIYIKHILIKHVYNLGFLYCFLFNWNNLLCLTQIILLNN